MTTDETPPGATTVDTPEDPPAELAQVQVGAPVAYWPQSTAGEGSPLRAEARSSGAGVIELALTDELEGYGDGAVVAGVVRRGGVSNGTGWWEPITA